MKSNYHVEYYNTGPLVPISHIDLGYHEEPLYLLQGGNVGVRPESQLLSVWQEKLNEGGFIHQHCGTQLHIPQYGYVLITPPENGWKVDLNYGSPHTDIVTLKAPIRLEFGRLYFTKNYGVVQKYFSGRKLLCTDIGNHAWLLWDGGNKLYKEPLILQV